MTSLISPLAPFLDHLITPDIKARHLADQVLHAFITLKHDVDPHFSRLHTPAPPPLELRKARRDHASRFVTWGPILRNINSLCCFFSELEPPQLFYFAEPQRRLLEGTGVDRS